MRDSRATRPPRRLLLIRRLGALLFTMTMLGIVSAAAPFSVAATGSCTGYTHYSAPPPYIRVLRQSGPDAGHSVKVRFKSWVKHVLGTQMPGYYPRESLRANAVYVKQYGWYYLLQGHWRGGKDRYGHCYDVKDAGDGWYVPEKRSFTSSQAAAVEATWNYTVRKISYGRWRFVLTGWRAGAFVSCARDSDGWHLMQHSAYYCGKDGLSWRQIITRYLTHSKVVTHHVT